MTEPDVLIVGAGPAGSVAATVLARAGARVRLLDRAQFPRNKLCGDTLNPGTLALLDRLNMGSAIRQTALPLDGMRVTGEGGVRIEAKYPSGLRALSLCRRELDQTLLENAVDAGAIFEPGSTVRSAGITDGGVNGVVISGHGQDRAIGARVVIAADGRHSTLAFGLGLSKHPRSPRRWAIGAYFDDVSGMSAFGEMHIRRGRYIGVAPTPGGLTNVCLVVPAAAGDPAMRDPAALLRRELSSDPLLRERFSSGRLVIPPTTLGPLAVDTVAHQIDGLILAGDAAGFIDPMTGDGLRFAVQGGELAALAALRALEHGWSGVHRTLASERRRVFGPKWRFNRTLRAIIASPHAVRAASAGARLAPGAIQSLVYRAGDCGLAGM